MTVAEFSVTPIGKGASVGTYVARCLEIVDRSGMPYRLNAMGTVVEGEFEDLLKLIGRCHTAVAEDCERVSTIVKIDDRKGVSGQLEAKVKAVEKRLGRKLRT
ncbi:MAG: MTH1187 family thiamine-binding protein [Methanobacteriota archaeon]|nr:MAG: MTH1187 family thiamine-binding protein [Euryarchaeota archaeon]